MYNNSSQRFDTHAPGQRTFHFNVIQILGQGIINPGDSKDLIRRSHFQPKQVLENAEALIIFPLVSTLQMIFMEMRFFAEQRDIGVHTEEEKSK